MENFSSFPPEEEREFVVYEERLNAAKRSAAIIGIGTAAGFGVLFLIIVIAFWSPLKPIIPPDEPAAPRSETRAAPAAAPAPAPAPAATTAAAPAEGTPAAAAPAAPAATTGTAPAAPAAPAEAPATK